MFNYDETIANRLAELGHVHRLAIYRTLIQAGDQGLPVGEVQKALQIPNSTLSHHISRMVNVGLVKQTRKSRTLYCIAQYRALNDVLLYLQENCCKGIDY